MSFEIPLYIYLESDGNELELVNSKGKVYTYKYIKSETKLDKLVSFKEQDLWKLMMNLTTKCDYTARVKKEVVKQIGSVPEPEEEEEVFERKVMPEKPKQENKIKPRVKKKIDTQIKLF